MTPLKPGKRLLILPKFRQMLSGAPTPFKERPLVPVTTDQDITVIAIGSSAGGLEAIGEFVSALSHDMAVAYVVAQHMSTHHKSLMSELVARQTSLPVRDIVDGMIPERNVIHITPPRTDVVFENGKLRLVDPSPGTAASPQPSVDRFLTSLAHGQGARTVAIILSGTGSDGADGVRAVREAGGITIAQDSETAKYNAMPHNAVQTDCIDLVLPPKQIGTHLGQIMSSPRDFGALQTSEPSENPVSELLQMLLDQTQVDFSEYRQAMINRRIERRMVAHGIRRREEYVALCRSNPQALDTLFKDLLISVTHFFRDRAEFEELRRLLPHLVEARGRDPLRVWIAGCATGQEVYSVAMLLAEALGVHDTPLKTHVQIFATDIDKDALRIARRGIYSVATLNEIPKEFADKYLTRHPDGVQVIDSLRNAILFADHDLCQDPPFQKIDLLCCRNLLIYFGNALQHKVLSRFHYALANDGFLFLGTAETVAGSNDLFMPEGQASHVFRKRTLRGADTSGYSGPPNVSLLRNQQRETDEAERATENHLFEALAAALGDKSVLVREDHAITRVHGDISPYIDIKASSALRMHLDLLRSSLREEARTLVTTALRNQAHQSGVRHLLSESDKVETRIEVYPIIATEIGENAALVVFTELPLNKVNSVHRIHEKRDSTAAGARAPERLTALETEIATTREALQKTIDKLETSKQELQALNEELQSTNEELHATNAELQTSNEELQSTNEELIIVNEELQMTAAELAGRTGELSSVIESTPLAVLVMDNALRISQATNTAVDRFGLRRPISNPHVSQCLLPDGYPDLAPLCSEAQKIGATVSAEFNSNEARVVLTCSPYFNVHGQNLGLTMVVSEFPGLAREMELLLGNSKVHVAHYTIDGTILRISESTAALLGLDREAAVGRNIYDLLDARTAAQLRSDDEQLLRGPDTYMRASYDVHRDSEPDIWLNVDKVMYSQEGQDAPTIYAVGTDISDVARSRDEAQSLVQQLTLLQDMARVGYWSVDLEKRTVHWSREVYRIHGVDPSEPQPPLEEAIEFYHPQDRKAVAKTVEEVVTRGGDFRFTKRIMQRTGGTVDVESHGIAIPDANGKVRRLIGVFRLLS